MPPSEWASTCTSLKFVLISMQILPLAGAFSKQRMRWQAVDVTACPAFMITWACGLLGYSLYTVRNNCYFFPCSYFCMCFLGGKYYGRQLGTPRINSYYTSHLQARMGVQVFVDLSPSAAYWGIPVTGSLAKAGCTLTETEEEEKDGRRERREGERERGREE